MKHIVKRKGHAETYDPRKLYASVYTSCLSVNSSSGEAELVAERVVSDVEKWLDGKQEVTANDIRRQAHKHLQVYNQDAAYMLENHRNHHV